MQPNRLERVWKCVRPEILKRWPRLSGEELEATEGQFDLLVEAIRRAYFPGRSPLSLEGEIRDWLNERMDHYENTRESVHF